MIKTIKLIFSDSHVNREAVTDNFLLLLMYRLAFPFAVILNKVGLSPNQITTQSLVCSVLAFLALVFDPGWVYFVCFWGFTILLDFCDGTVARMANKVSKIALRYDHVSDLFKIFLVILGAALRYDDYWVWALAMCASFFFMYYSVLNHELDSAQKKQARLAVATGDTETQTQEYVRLSDRYRIIGFLIKFKPLIALLKNLYSALVTINGHTLLLMLLLAVNSVYASLVFSYLILVSLLNIFSRIRQLVNIKR